MNNKIIKLQLGDYFKWKNLSREDKVKRNKQIAKLYLDKGPSILNYYNALKAYFGGFNPKNPYLQTGEPIITPGMNPTKGVLTAAKAVRTLEDYLKTTKVTAPALEGSSMARSAYATDRYIGGRMFLNTLPEEAMKILGHGMAKSPTILDALARLRYILDNGIKGKFYTGPLKVSLEAARAGEAIGTGGATPYFDGHFLITGKPGLMINSVDDIGTIYINDAYENEEALKAAQKMKEYLTKTYPNKVFKLYSEGFKKGGTIKADNARKWKHKSGGLIIKEFKLKLKFLLGGSVDWGLMASNILNAGILTYSANKLIDALTKLSNADLDKKYSQMIQSLQEMNREKLKEYWMNWVNNVKNGLSLENMSPEVLKHFGQNSIGWLMGNAKDETSKLKKANDDAATSLKAANYAQLFGTVANTALNAFGLYMANKLKNTPTVLATTVLTTPQIYTGTNGSINTNYSNLYTGTNGSLRFD